MNIQHKGLSAGRWISFSFFEQMANIGSEVSRSINWKNKGNEPYKNASFERALELFDLTIGDPKNVGRLKELTRLREVFVDFLIFDNQYGLSDTKWNDYFYSFNLITRSHA